MDDNQNQEESKEKRGTTLDLQNLSISTLKDDMAKDSNEQQKDQGGWFKFLAKHKDVSSSSGLEKNKNGEKEELTGSSLDKELDQFKAETDQPVDSSKDVSLENIAAPSNLPISDEAPAEFGKENPADLGEIGEIPQQPSSAQDVTALEHSTLSPEQLAEEPAALGSFFPPQTSEPVEENNLQDNSAKTPPNFNENKSSDSSLPKENIGLQGSNNPVKVGKIEPFSRAKEGITEGTAGSGEKSDEIGTEEANPFSSRITKVEKDDKSLLHDVESALNYSAPPDFSKERESLEQELTGESGEEGQVVDLRSKAGAKGGLFKSKKMVIILGSVVGLFIISIVVLSLILGNKNQASQKPQAAETAKQDNKNQNVNPLASSPIKQVVPVTPKPTPISPQKVLPNTKEINVKSIDGIATEVENVRQGEPVRQQTQLIFLKPDGSATSFQDLMNSTGINIPQKILAKPSTVAALFFADFFLGKTTFGLIIPTTDTDPDLTESKMKSWEQTMVTDLYQLWKGISIDNQKAYFSDSKLFPTGRYALIDKKKQLSLDYLVDKGYIFITCGKDSMTILKKQFTGNSQGADSADTGIKWENTSGDTDPTGSSPTTEGNAGSETAKGISGTGSTIDGSLSADDAFSGNSLGTGGNEQ